MIARSVPIPLSVVGESGGVNACISRSRLLFKSEVRSPEAAVPETAAPEAAAAAEVCGREAIDVAMAPDDLEVDEAPEDFCVFPFDFGFTKSALEPELKDWYDSASETTASFSFLGLFDGETSRDLPEVDAVDLPEVDTAVAPSGISLATILRPEVAAVSSTMSEGAPGELSLPLLRRILSPLERAAAL